MRGQNLELNDRMLEVGEERVVNRRRVNELRVEEEEVRNRLKRQLSEEVIVVGRSKENMVNKES